MEQIILSGLTIGQLKEILKDTFKEVSEKKGKGKNDATEKEGKFISRKETAKLLYISLPTLNEWTKEGVLKSYRIGTRILYKPEEVLECVTRRNFTQIASKIQ